MKLELKKPLFTNGDKFEDLGSLKEILCSFSLSEIIRKSDKFPPDFKDYRLLRITKSTGEKFIRVS